MFFPPWCGTLEIKHTRLRKVCEALCGTAPGCAEVGLVAALAPEGWRVPTGFGCTCEWQCAPSWVGGGPTCVMLSSASLPEVESEATALLCEGTGTQWHTEALQWVVRRLSCLDRVWLLAGAIPGHGAAPLGALCIPLPGALLITTGPNQGSCLVWICCLSLCCRSFPLLCKDGYYVKQLFRLRLSVCVAALLKRNFREFVQCRCVVHC